MHAAEIHAMSLHRAMYVIEAFIVAAITGLSLQTVAHLYRSAVEHHPPRHHMPKLARTEALTGHSTRLPPRALFQARAANAEHATSPLSLTYLHPNASQAIQDRNT